MVEKVINRIPVYSETSVYVLPNWADKIVKFYKNYSFTKFNIFVDIVLVDIPRKKNRFIIKYLLLSLLQKRIEIVFEINEYSSVKSIVSLFSGASWVEREIWDFFGIFFLKHNDLRHLLLDYGFQGFPLRKDHPLVGFEEVFYDDKIKKLVTKDIQFMQEYRNFYYLNQWESFWENFNDKDFIDFDLEDESFLENFEEQEDILENFLTDYISEHWFEEVSADFWNSSLILNNYYVAISDFSEELSFKNNFFDYYNKNITIL
jgi:NADH-quinone oxidoreductase subunit C